MPGHHDRLWAEPAPVRQASSRRPASCADTTGSSIIQLLCPEPPAQVLLHVCSTLGVVLQCAVGHLRVCCDVQHSSNTILCGQLLINAPRILSCMPHRAESIWPWLHRPSGYDYGNGPTQRQASSSSTPNSHPLWGPAVAASSHGRPSSYSPAATPPRPPPPKEELRASCLCCCAPLGRCWRVQG